MKKIALLGFGTVGSGVAEILTNEKEKITEYVGEAVEVSAILDLRTFEDSPYANLVTPDFNKILNDKEITLVCEMMGGAHPAYDFTKACLEAGKSVVTSNKQVVATFGKELFEIAKAHGVSYGFEASVGGGIPVLNPMQKEFVGNKILSVSGILNGTTNYILTKMEEENLSLETALKQAQDNGYAEKDPTADVEGIDASRKICILSALAFNILPDADKIHRKGIMQITSKMIEGAKKLGGRIKLIGKCDENGASVNPHFVPYSHPLSSVSDVFNAICVEGKETGKVTFVGKGAGKLPTASAVVSDIANILSGKQAKTPTWQLAKNSETKLGATAHFVCVNGCPKCASKAEQIFNCKPIFVCEGNFVFLSEKEEQSTFEEKINTCNLSIEGFLPVLE